ncbi:uncharacterized protein CBL_09378 [Carabus blaptoides fortunei]
MNTLRGVFPEPAPVHRRNFIKENMIHIKRMQGLIEDPNEHKPASAERSTSHSKLDSKTRSNPPNQRTMKLMQTTRKELQNLALLSLIEKPRMISAPRSDKNIPSKKGTRYKSKQCEKGCMRIVKETCDKHRCKDIAVQTDETDSANQMHDNRMKSNEKSSSSTTHSTTSPRRHSIRSPLPHRHSVETISPKFIGDGDNSKLKHNSSQDPNTAEKKHDFVKENAQVVKQQTSKSSPPTDPTLPPPTYQKGVIPKYIKERKEELIKKSLKVDDGCPPNHVLLPDDEKKETLRMIKQSYAELITELNMLPVRSDTLKIRNRKKEIEDQLDKLEEGMSVFSRPKVFVRIDV